MRSDLELTSKVLTMMLSRKEWGKRFYGQFGTV
jgi:hypothetical protein